MLENLSLVILGLAFGVPIGAFLERWVNRPKNRESREIEHVSVKPNDSFVISYGGLLTVDQRAAIESRVEAFRRGEKPVLVLSGGLRLAVFSGLKAP